MTVLHDECLHFVNDISISACWMTPRTLVTVSWHAAIFKATEPLFNMSDPQCIIPESLPNFSDFFHLVNPKFMIKSDAVSLLQAFCHLKQNKNVTNTCYTTSLPGSDRRIRRCCKAVKKIMHAYDSPFYYSAQFLHPFATTYHWKKYSLILFGQTS